MKINGVYLTFS